MTADVWISPEPTCLADIATRIDGKRVGRRGWRVDVLGIHAVGSDVWLQVGRQRESLETLLVRITPGATTDDVLEALAGATPSRNSMRIVTVSPSTIGRTVH